MQRLLAWHRGDLLVLGYAAVAQVEMHVWYPTLSLLPRLLLLAGVLSLLARRRFPRLAPLACAAGGAATSAWLDEQHTGTAIVPLRPRRPCWAGRVAAAPRRWPRS